nr:2-amino-4-hydroxy-6-hydroxymethyldihydropteridine diphosphokinase [Evansella caseinilytica]
MAAEAFLSLGSNIEDRLAHLKEALELLEKDQEILLEKISSVYETAPVGYINQHPFLNVVVKITTSLKPFALLEHLQEIERAGGREREIRWGPRTIDLDILLYNNENINLEHLQIPHPRMFERGFVLIPFYEIEPGYQFSDGKSIVQYIEELTNKEGVQKWKSSFGEDE